MQWLDRQEIVCTGPAAGHRAESGPTRPPAAEAFPFGFTRLD